MYFKWFVHDTPPFAQSEMITVSQVFRVENPWFLCQKCFDTNQGHSFKILRLCNTK